VFLENKGQCMTTAEVIEKALKLKASDRYLLLELLCQSFDKANPEIEQVWKEEALRRLHAIKQGDMKTVSFEEIFGSNP